MRIAPSLLSIAAASVVALACGAGPRPTSPQPAPRFEIQTQSEDQLRAFFIEQGDALDPIEGIWHLSGRWSTLRGESGTWDARLAIVRDTIRRDRDFVEVNLEADGSFPLYAITAHFTRTTSPGVYVSRQFGPDGSFSYVTLTFNEHDQLVGTREETRSGGTFHFEWRYLRLEPRAAAAARRGRAAASSGTGFLLTESGVVVTNQHVVDGGAVIEVYVPRAPSRYRARVIAQDRQNDLALLQLEEFRYQDLFSRPVPFRVTRGHTVALGEEVFTLGFPLSDIMGSTARLSVGQVSSLYGIDDDPRVLQISNPLQPGNSGGPLLNRSLDVIGIVVSTLNASYLFERARILPQNVNFAVKAAYLEALLGTVGVTAPQPRRQTLPSLEQAVDAVLPYVVQVRSSP